MPVVCEVNMSVNFKWYNFLTALLVGEGPISQEVFFYNIFSPGVGAISKIWG